MTNNHWANAARAFTLWWRESNNIRNKIKRFASSFGRLAMQYVDFFISFLIINILSLHFPCTWSEINTNSPYVIFFSFYIIFDPLYFHRLFVESQFLMLIIRRMTSIGEKMLLFWSLRTIPNDPQPLKECLCVRVL